MVVYRKDLWRILSGLLKFRNNDETRFSLKIILSMVPAALVGLLFEEQLEAFFSGNTVFVGSMLMVTAALLFLADRAKNTHRPVSFADSLFVGLILFVCDR